MAIHKRLIKAVLTRRGYELRPAAPPARDDGEREAFAKAGDEIQRRHRAQTRETVAALRKKYAGPVWGRVETWSVLERLAQCVDPTDTRLYGASQQMHVLQVLAAMESAGVTDRALLAAALLHDIGKVLLLTGEAPEHVVCFNGPIGEHEPGCGLDAAWLQWNHDEFGYSRLKDEVDEPVAWLVRYHSIDPARCAPLFDARDRAYAERYLAPFRHYDLDSKSPCTIPRKRLADYRGLAEALLPSSVVL